MLLLLLSSLLAWEKQCRQERVQVQERVRGGEWGKKQHGGRRYGMGDSMIER